MAELMDYHKHCQGEDELEGFYKKCVHQESGGRMGEMNLRVNNKVYGLIVMPACG